MYKILTLNKISKFGTARFDAKYTVGEDIADPDAVMVRSASMHEMELPASLAAIARAGAGVNNIPVELCSEKGIAVFNTPGANANAVKELVICSLLLASRKIADSLDWCKTLKGKGDEVGKLVEKGKSSFEGPEIAGKTLGIVGMGAIGVLVAQAADALGMKIVGFDPVVSADDIKTPVTMVADLDALYAQADYISLHAPLNDKTKGMINTETFAKMKDGVRILNFARGELVASSDMVAALESGKASAYVTDFPTDEQIGVKGVVAIPHLGASTPESEDNCAVMAADELIAYLEKGEIKNSVNLPDTKLPESFKKRFCVIHKDDKAVQESVASFFTCLLVTSLVTGAKKGWAYTVVDADGDICLADLEALEGVAKVRALG